MNGPTRLGSTGCIPEVSNGQSTFVACWSTKGGSGVSVVSAAIGLMLSAVSSEEVWLVDLGGDLPTVLDLSPPAGPGVGDWLTADAEPGALFNLGLEIRDGLRLIPRGTSAFDAKPGALAAALLGQRQPVVVDCGPPGDGIGEALAALAPTSLLVLRPCFLALRRTAATRISPTGVVVVEEIGRVLTHRDVAESLNVETVGRVRWDPAVARAVDAGTLKRRVPRSLCRGLRPLVEQLGGPAT